MELWIKERVLGTGSFGIVTLWKNTKTNQRLALKQCRLDIQSTLSDCQKERWCKEIEIMVKLNHENIVKAIILPRFLSNMLKCSIPGLCMEYCSRGDLRRTLNQPQNCCGLTEAEVRNFILHIKNALQYLHDQKIIHRDIKPENVLLQEAFEKIVYKLTDLGYAKELNQQGGQCSSFIVGTLQYLAPELFLGRNYDNSVDYWSFGLVCYEVITGLRPFLPQSPYLSLWMNYAKSKRHEHICIYQSTSGCVRYSSRLFVENQISQCFQHHLERWLQGALEWESHKRGFCKDNEIPFFSQLDSILDKKILTLFCSCTHSLLSYEVDSSTAVATLQGWIERDTKLNSETQMLLTWTGGKVENNKFAVEYYFREKDIMIYIYDTSNALSLPNVKARQLSGLVQKIMENPLGMLNYFYLKRAVSQAINFVQSDYKLFLGFYKAYTIKRSYTEKKVQDLNSLSANILMELNKILSNRKMCAKLLNFDIKCYRHLFSQVHGADLVSEWQKRHQGLSEKVDDLLLTFHDVKIRCDKMLSKGCELENDDINIAEVGIQKYNQYLQSLYNCFEKLPKDKEKLSTPIDAVQIVRDFLNQRSILMKNVKFNAHLQKLWTYEVELTDLEICMQEIKNAILTIKSGLMDIQLSQRKEIWQTLACIAVMERPHKTTENEKQSAAHTKQTFTNSVLTLNQDSGFVDGDGRISYQRGTEAETILGDNEKIRNTLLTNLEKMNVKYRAIKDESESIDWTFLNTDQRNN